MQAQVEEVVVVLPSARTGIRENVSTYPEGGQTGDGI